MNFNVDYSDFARKLIPYFLRKSKMLGFIKSVVAPLQSLNSTFLEFRNAIAFKLAFNSQIIYLEQYLNTVYPNPFNFPNNIHIQDGANISYFYVWNHIENQSPVHFWNFGETYNVFYLGNSSEQTGDVFSYIIRVPTYCQGQIDLYGFDFDETRFRSRVNFYNLAGKTYDIEYF